MDTLTTSASFGRVFRDYYELTKPKIWYLLVFTAFASALTASFLFDIPTSPVMWLLLILGVAAGSAAADT
jgi:protoheme IX farnesyltransferase